MSYLGNLPRPQDSDAAKKLAAELVDVQLKEKVAEDELNKLLEPKGKTLDDQIDALLYGKDDGKNLRTVAEVSNEVRLLKAAEERTKQRYHAAISAADNAAQKAIAPLFGKQALEPLAKALLLVKAAAEKEQACRYEIDRACVSFGACLRRMHSPISVDQIDNWIKELHEYYPTVAV